ncbi:MAG: hypothetical protein LQ343_004171 [Gyalolechia ehrenbergii]|nr:MAG: hypothetical protein LQ343_004171 [Gyalolechia ehrenbergii]
MRTMVSVASLLNPSPPDKEQPNTLPTPCSFLYSPEVSARMPLLRKQKLCKDEATFIMGKPQEEVKYWPCEYQDGHIAAEHRKYQMYPIGHITEYCKHVPYRSEKKTFLSKTGREGFHVFQYTFQMPHDEKRQTVMWDYNNGLVRVTPFFKALEYPKTTPARMLAKNPGLKEIVHSITGGSLAAQGYWMPFEAARAVAATFCFRIRYVLTPIFGLDFPAQCIPPGTPGFDSMHVAPKIIRKCIEAVRESHEVYRLSKSRSRPETPSSVGTRSWTPINAATKASKTVDSESGYGTDTECSETYAWSPQRRAKSGLTSRETPRSVGMRKRFKFDCSRSAASSRYGDESESSDDCRKRKRVLQRSTDTDDDDDDGSVGYDCSWMKSLKQCASPVKRRKASSTPAITAESAAMMLLELRLQDAALRGKGGEAMKRRASA